MWIFQNNSFVSVVAEYDGNRPTGRLLVRSRVKGDIQRAIPGAEVFENVDADYRYRALIAPDALKAAMMSAVDRIDYPNFKNSISKREPNRKHAYMGVWQAMANVFGAYVGHSWHRRPATVVDRVSLADLGLGEHDSDIDAYVNGEPV